MWGDYGDRGGIVVVVGRLQGLRRYRRGCGETYRDRGGIAGVVGRPTGHEGVS